MRKLNCRGQVFAPYRLVIGAVMGLLIMLIVVGAIDYFTNLKFDISTQQLFDGFGQAIEAHDNSIVVKEDLSLEPGSFAAVSFAEQYNIPKECIEFQSSGISSYSIPSGGKEIILNNAVYTTVYFKCGPDFAMPSECEFYCIISFGKKPSD